MIQTLDRPTLVLNRNWQPVTLASVARALTLVVGERARIVDPTDFQQYTWGDWAKLVPQTDELFIQSVTFRVRVPEVITLLEYDRVPKNAVTFSRRNIFRRDHFTCQYCHRHPRARSLAMAVNLPISTPHADCCNSSGHHMLYKNNAIKVFHTPASSKHSISRRSPG